MINCVTLLLCKHRGLTRKAIRKRVLKCLGFVIHRGLALIIQKSTVSQVAELVDAMSNGSYPKYSSVLSTLGNTIQVRVLS